MYTSLKKRRVIILVGLPILALASSTLLALTLATGTTPYSIYNYGDYGFSELYKASKLVIWSPRDVEELEADKYALVVPMIKKPKNETIRELLNWISRGGSIIILDEKGYSNQLLAELNLPLEISNHRIYDPLSNDGSRENPLAITILDGEEFRLVFHTVASLDLRGEQDTTVVLARSSILSYTDLDNNGYYSFSDSISSKPLVVLASKNKFTIIIVPDLDFLSNYCIRRGDNMAFVKSLLGEKTIVLYNGLSNMSSLDLFKHTYYSSIGSIGITLADLSLLLLLSFSLILVNEYENR